jgi:putative addiction module component (TIGR02574 family)
LVVQAFVNDAERAAKRAAVDSDLDGRYPRIMSKDEITREALSLPLPERVLLAEVLWRSIDERPDEERAAVAEALRRNAELSDGAVSGRTHEQVMDAARRSLG